MLVNTYIYKGPHNSLLAPCIIASFTVPEADYEHLIPGVSELYKFREDLLELTSITHNLDIHISSIDSSQINSLGDAAVKDSLNRTLLSYRTKAMADKDVCYIKHVKQPKTWSERLVIILAVFYRRKLLESLSDSRMNLLKLDSNYKKHIEAMAHYKYLPPIYHWEKSMRAFDSVFPRPLWYTRELQTIERINKEL